MKFSFNNNFFKNRFIIFSFIFTLFLNLINLYIVNKKVGKSLDVIPLHYNIYFGIDWYGPARWFYLYPILGFSFLFINFISAYFLYIKFRKLSYLFSGMSLLFSIFLILIVFLVNVENLF